MSEPVQSRNLLSIPTSVSDTAKVDSNAGWRENLEMQVKAHWKHKGPAHESHLRKCPDLFLFCYFSPSPLTAIGTEKLCVHQLSFWENLGTEKMYKDM